MSAQAIESLTGHIQRALDFYSNKDNIWFGIGKTTAWAYDPTGAIPNTNSETSDTNPPDPSSTSVLLEPAGYKKIERAYIVYPDSTGELSYAGYTWKIVTDATAANAIAVGAKWVFIDAWLKYSELDTSIAYRQASVFENLVRATGVDTKLTALYPSQVSSQGVLQLMYNFTPVNRDYTRREHLVSIIEF